MFLLTWLAKLQFRIQMESLRVACRFGSSGINLCIFRFSDV